LLGQSRQAAVSKLGPVLEFDQARVAPLDLDVTSAAALLVNNACVFEAGGKAAHARYAARRAFRLCPLH